MTYEGYEVGKGWQADAFGARTPADVAYFQAETRSLRVPDGSVRLLEVGFGNGSFLGWAAAQGWECVGVEVNETLRERCRQAGFASFASVEELRRSDVGHAFDVVAAFDVLEHIERTHLVGFVTALRDLLKPAGMMLLRFPNGDNPFSMPMQNGDVTHRTAIGQAMVRQVAMLSGLEVLELREPVQASPGIGWKRRLARGLGRPVRRAVGALLRHVFMGGAPVVFSSNLVAVLRRPAI